MCPEFAFQPPALRSCQHMRPRNRQFPVTCLHPVVLFPFLIQHLAVRSLAAVRSFGAGPSCPRVRKRDRTDRFFLLFQQISHAGNSMLSNKPDIFF